MSSDQLYVCQHCSVVTFDDVEECPACGDEREPDVLMFTRRADQ